jgi:F420H(2)-dependent quinone reductase
MPLQGEYEPSPEKWVRDQVDEIEGSGGTRGNELRGMPVIVLTTKGAKSGKLRKNPLMRVEHDGVYAAVASMGGAPKNPTWYHNVKADPHVELRDATQVADYTAREIDGDEYDVWWDRAVAAYPDYADYQTKTSRKIPLILLEK